MISISPGHYGPRTGASGLIDEVTEAIKVSKEVARILRASSITTNYIEDNVSKSQSKNIPWLISQHNKSSRQIDVSVHFNASGGTHDRGIGTETLIYSGNNQDTAAAITDAIARVSGLRNRGVKIRKDLGILKGTNKPCYLIEVCFVNSRTDVELYRKHFDAICHAIAEELAKAVNKTLKSTANQTVKVETQKASDWAKDAQEWVVANNISDGLNPLQPVTREQVWAMLQRMNNLK